MMKKILPQANNLDTLINVFIYFCNKKNCTLQDIANFCNFDVRQASYYLNACLYLDLVDEKQNLTEFGNKVLTLPNKIREQIYARIINDKLIGKVFARILLFPEDNIKNFTIDLLSEHYPEYSEAVIKRRTSTIINWCKDIINYTSKEISCL